MSYYVGHSTCELWGLVWSELINLNYVSDIESLKYHFFVKIQQNMQEKAIKLVWFASFVWYDRVSSDETSLFRPIYLVWVL